MGVIQSISQLALAVNILFLLLLGFSFAFLEAGTGAYVVMQLTLIPVVLSLIGSLVVLYAGWEPLE